MDDLEKLQEFEKTRGKLRLPLDIKPCITDLLNGHNPASKQGLNPFIIACELHRVGKNQQQIKSLLTKVNVKPSKLRSALKSALTGRYGYACPGLEEKGLCLFKSRFDCWWFDKIPRESQKEWREDDFWRYHWPDKLGSARSMLYLAIRQVEKLKGYQAGSRLYVSWDQLQRVSGVNRQTIKPGLEALEKIGLITYKPGQKRVKGSKGLATEVVRIIPIPKP
ncbi:unnamed protein product [marine sediment metagenome]|uniref:Uncharacterized protein n=1 Tax=marine sediment metagenome TaxID=412755 RepID=X1KY37_9ZZZZ